MTLYDKGLKERALIPDGYWGITFQKTYSIICPYLANVLNLPILLSCKWFKRKRVLITPKIIFIWRYFSLRQTYFWLNQPGIQNSVAINFHALSPGNFDLYNSRLSKETFIIPETLLIYACNLAYLELIRECTNWS